MMAAVTENSQQTVAMDKINILPPEIWQEIIEWLPNPQDLFNLYHSCTFFQSLMAELRTTALFPGVLPILHKQYSSSRKEVPIFKSIMLNCRQVCKSWNQSVNNFVSDYPTTTQNLDSYFHKNPKPGYNFGDDFPTFPIVLSIGIQLEETQKIRNILEFCESHQEILPSPFFNRQLVIKGLPYMRRTPQYLEATTTLKELLLNILKIVGPHIWHFSVYPNRRRDEYFSSTEESDGWWDVLIQSLNLLPNLKTLLIHWPDMYFIAPLSERVSPDTIPPLPYLQVFQSPSRHMPEKIWKSFLDKSGQMKKIYLDSSLETNWTSYDSKFWEWAGFKNLQLSHFSLKIDLLGFEYLKEPEDIEHDDEEEYYNFEYENSSLESFQFIHWPLTELVMDGVIMSTENLVKTLKRFEGSLTHLCIRRIRQPKNGVFEIAAILKALPNLKHLEFDTGHWFDWDRGLQVDCLDGDVKFKVCFGPNKMVFCGDSVVVIFNMN